MAVNITPISRLILFLIGAGILSTLMIFSFRWEDTGITFDFVGLDISVYALAFVYVLMGLVGSSLIKSAILGRMAID